MRQNRRGWARPGMEAAGMSMKDPTAGTSHSSHSATNPEAFSPVVTMARQSGIRRNNVSISASVTTSRNASEALSRRRRTSQAVS